MKLRPVLDNALSGLRRDRAIFCGMTANVDVVIPFADDDFLLAQERFGSAPPSSAQPPAPNIVDAAHALDYAAWFMARGTGGEAEIPSIRPFTELLDMLPSFQAVGGTGGQAANWLAWAGFKNTVLYVPYYDDAFKNVLNLEKMEIVDNNDGYAEIMADDPTFSEVHCIFDYQRGSRLSYGGEVISAPRHDRIIFDGDRCAAKLRISQRFHDRACGPHKESSLLVTGSNLCRGLDDFYVFLDDCDSLMRDYRARNAGGHSFIHVEDSFQWSEARERRTALVDRVWPLADSVGMNEAEFKELCQFFGLDAADPDAALLHLAKRCGLRRVCLHTAANCRTVTKFPLETELAAIGLAILFSSAKAFYGKFVGVEEIGRLIEDTGQISEKAEIEDPVVLSGGYERVIVPTLSGMPLRSSIGLGDAFTAGLMAYL